MAENSKGHIILLNHPGTATTGPLYGNATTNLLEFDGRGNFVREIGQGVYGLGYGHSVRFDDDDNLWVVDKGTNAVTKFDPAGYVTLNLGRRPEGFDHYEHVDPREARHVDGYFQGPTDVGWDPDGNIFVSDGYMNSRVGKMDKHGNWLKSWGTYGTGNDQLRLPHNPPGRPRGLRLRRRPQQQPHPEVRLGRQLRQDDPAQRAVRQDAAAGAGQPPAEPARQHRALDAVHLGRRDAVPVRVGRGAGAHLQDDLWTARILGWLGESGRQLGQFNWVHGISCRDENVLIVADMNNWRVQKLLLNQTALPTDEE